MYRDNSSEEGYPEYRPTYPDQWKYPSNYPIRNYQLSIVKECLFSNTLVALPTGLGKTLIASVVMLNYYHWFPEGIIIFMAPTRPLVTQQISACYSIVGIPETDSAHIEGNVSPQTRESLWKCKRVVFCTPQTLLNDLLADRLQARKIVCLVVDEAHRATANYAYTQVVQRIASESNHFRILALSATPGSDKKKIQDVIRNLLISHVEVRSEDDEDIAQYTNHKKLDIITCPKINSMSSRSGAFGTDLKGLFANVMKPSMLALTSMYVLSCENANYLNSLVLDEATISLERRVANGYMTPNEASILHEHIIELQYLVSARKQFNDGQPALAFAAMKQIQQSLQCRNGLTDKLIHSHAYRQLLAAFSAQAAANFKPVDPKREAKLYQLRAVLDKHFSEYSANTISGNPSTSTRAIVFTLLRASVFDILEGLKGCPGVRAREFIGQSSNRSAAAGSGIDFELSEGIEIASNSKDTGMTQKEQAQVLASFNKGEVNVLVATCIAEEGLDIAEVDLIVFFEAIASPIRLVQRMGRTGRRRAGRVVMLVADGAEKDKLAAGQSSATKLSNLLRQAAATLQLYDSSPRMIPRGIPLPTMALENLDIPEFHMSQVGGTGMATRKPKVSKSDSKVDAASSKEVSQSSHLHGMQRSLRQFMAGPEAHSFNTSLPEDHFETDDYAQAALQQSLLISTKHHSENIVLPDEFSNLDEYETELYGNPYMVPAPSPGSFDIQIQEANLNSPVKLLDQHNVLNVVDNSTSLNLNCDVNPGIKIEDDYCGVLDDTWISEEFIQKHYFCNDYKEFVAGIKGEGNSNQDDSNILCGTAQRGHDIWQSIHSGLTTFIGRRANDGRVSVSAISKSSGKFEEVPTQSGRHSEIIYSQRLSQVNQKLTFFSQKPSQAESHFPSQTVCARFEIAESLYVSESDSDSGEMTLMFPVNAQSSNPSAHSALPSTRNDEAGAIAFEGGKTERNDRSEMVIANEFANHTVSSKIASDFQVCLSDDDDDEDDEKDPIVVQTSGGANKCDEYHDDGVFNIDIEDSNISESMTYDEVDFNANFQESCDTSSSSLCHPSAPSTNGLVNLQHPTGSLSIPEMSKDTTPESHRAARHSSLRTSPSPQGSAASQSDDDYCVVCLSKDWNDDDQLMYCHGDCRQCVHVSCYGLSCLPDGDFVCEGCQAKNRTDNTCNSWNQHVGFDCFLCKQSDGMKRRSTCGKLAHFPCVAFCPELTFNDSMRLNNLSSLHTDRQKLACAHCEIVGGAIIQCAFSKCLIAFHPFCAEKAEKLRVIRERFSAGSTGLHPIGYEIYCSNHQQFCRVQGIIECCGAAGDLCAAQDQQEDWKPKSSAVEKSPAVRIIPTLSRLPLSPMEDEHLLQNTQCASSGRRVNLQSRRLKRRCDIQGIADRDWNPSRRTETKGQRDYAPSGQVRQRDRQPGHEERRLKRKRIAEIYKPHLKLFDEEAILSASSDSGDENESVVEACSADEAAEADSFINDGSFTQSQSDGSFVDANALYFAVNSKLAREDSPSALRFGFRGSEKGLPIIERILRKEKLKQMHTGKSRSATCDGSPAESDFSVKFASSSDQDDSVISSSQYIEITSDTSPSSTSSTSASSLQFVSPSQSQKEEHINEIIQTTAFSVDLLDDGDEDDRDW